MKLVKQDLDTWLDNVKYEELNSGLYVPTDFSLHFMNFIKLVNGGAGESNKTPPVHLKMLDKLVGNSDYVANLCFRGAGKTAVFMEYLALYLGMFGWLPNFGRVDAMLYISDSMDNGVKSARKNIEHRYHASEFCQEWIPHYHFTDNYIELGNQEKQNIGIKMFGAKTGLRGTKIFGKRPVLAVLDDLVSDDDATSKAAMSSIKDTVYKGVNNALDPTRRKVIFNGTPFNKDDILIEAVESGGWDVNVWPVCAKFPCTEEEFSGAWPDRFSYKFIKEQYEFAVLTGKIAAFYQELMLRITSDDDRLIQESEIRWYNRRLLLDNKESYNFYITTDFATSVKQTADYSVISVWAYNAKGDWFWVDGICARQLIDKSFDDLFNFVSIYKPQSVGIEVAGQQQAYIRLLQNMQQERNIWFTFASSEKSNEPGIRPMADKLQRLNLVVPWFKAGKFYFPEEMRTSTIMGMFLQQMRLATASGLKGKDDCLDTISMLGFLKPWKPSESAPTTTSEVEVWDEDEPVSKGTLASYIV